MSIARGAMTRSEDEHCSWSDDEIEGWERWEKMMTQIDFDGIHGERRLKSGFWHLSGCP